MYFRWMIVCLGLALAGCGMKIPVDIPTSPDSFSIDPGALSHLPRPGAIAILNGHTGEPKWEGQVHPNVWWVFDLKQMTDSAAVMLSRAMEKSGVAINPQADKKVTLRVRVLGAQLRRVSVVTRTTGRVALHAAFGDGSGTYVEGDHSDGSMLNQMGKTFDGALLDALNHLLADEKFVAYIKR